MTLDLLERFRLLLGVRPLALAVALVALVLLAHLLVRRLLPGRHAVASVGVERLAPAAGAAAIAVFVLSAIWYATNPHFFDNAEPTIVAIGWLARIGAPLYPALDAAERYAHIYGPMAYLLHGLAFTVLGPGVGVAKGLSAAAGIGSVGLTWLAVRTRCGARCATALTGGGAVVLLMFRNYAFWTRPEPFQLLAVSVSLLAAVGGRGPAASVVVGVASGVLWNLKFTGVLYSLPVFALLYLRVGPGAAGRGAVLGAVALAVATAAAPFVLLSNVSFDNYAAWVRLSAETGVLRATVIRNLEWAIYLALPLLTSYFAIPAASRRRDAGPQLVTVSLLVGMAGVVIAAAKPGAGPYHLIPFVPTILCATAWHLRACRASVPSAPLVRHAALSVVLAACLTATAQQAQFHKTMAERRGLGEVADVEAFADRHDGVIEMGYGGTEALSFARPVLVFRSGSYLIDQPAVREHQLARLPFPAATTDAVARCRVAYWLIPKGEAPFSGRNAYTAVLLQPLFPDVFRETFHATHEHVSTTAYYDVWRCVGRRPG